MSQLRIIDPHQHFWKLDAPHGYPWLQKRPLGPSVAGDLARIAHDYLIPDYLADTAGFNVVKSVHVEAIAQDPVAETEWLQGLADEHGFPHGAVVRTSLHQPDVERELERQCPGSASSRGVRDILNWHKNPSVSYIDRSDLLTDPAWLRGFALLKKFNLSFDMQLYPLQMIDAAAVAQRHPDHFYHPQSCGHARRSRPREPRSLAQGHALPCGLRQRHRQDLRPRHG